MNNSVILLPSELTIVQAEEVKNQLLTAINEHDEVSIDDSQLVRIDTLGLQLLLAFVIHVTSKNKQLNWQCQSNVIKESVKQLGINDPILNKFIII